ncbi:MAG: hypothetical protein ACK4KV_21565 [Rhodocyclaceae bacterium]
MGLFLQILLAVALVVALGVVLAYFWARRWVRRKVADLSENAEILDLAQQRVPRIRLTATDVPEDCCESLREAWPKWHALGFRKIGDFSDRNGGFLVLRLAAHVEQRLGLALGETEQGQPVSVVFALTDGKRLVASADGLGPALSSSSAEWVLDDGQAPAMRVGLMQARLGEVALRAVDPSMVKSVFERAYALVMDAEIAAGPPTRQAIELRAAERGSVLDAERAEIAERIGYDAWRSRMEEAALDNWRRASKVDAVTWERLDGDVHVVDRVIRVEALRNYLCHDEQSTRLFDQLLSQGHTGPQLYREVQERLPVAARRVCIGEVRRPVRAMLFASPEMPAGESDLGARAHGYEGQGEDGRVLRGSVLANDASDAHAQLQSMGVASARVVTEPSPGVPDSVLNIDPRSAALMVRAAREPVPLAVVRSLGASVWIWLPPLLLLGWSLSDGGPLSWGDWLIIGYALLAAAAMVVLVAPMLLYNQMARAKLLGQWRRARLCLALLRRVNLLGGITRAQLLAERCKLLAAEGHHAEALALWQEHEADFPPDQYLSELAQIHDAAGDTDAMIEVQRQTVEHSTAKAMPRVDLAMSLVRYQRAADEAERVLGAVSPRDLSELVLSGYHYTRGMILAERNQHGPALRHYQQAIEHASGYRGQPLIAGLIAEINGYVALSLRAAGEPERADALWRTVLPVLNGSASSHMLILRYEDAMH